VERLVGGENKFRTERFGFAIRRDGKRLGAGGEPLDGPEAPEQRNFS
jgi:hypothetical protein